METTNSIPTPPKKNRIKRILKFLLYGISFLIILIFLFNWIWDLSGSTEWKLELDRNGVKVYSLKFPGSSIKNFKANYRVKCSMNQLVAGLIENENYESDTSEWLPGCVAFKVLEPFNSKSMANTMLYEFKLFPPFANREIIMKSQISIDKQKKVVYVDVMANPNRIPLNEGRVRSSHMHNRWTYTPLENGEIEIDFYQETTMSGLFPNLPMNLFGAEQVHKYLYELPKMLDKEKYKKVKYDFIEELGIK